jgi:hypothetical protein
MKLLSKTSLGKILHFVQDDNDAGVMLSGAKHLDFHSAVLSYGDDELANINLYLP